MAFGDGEYATHRFNKRAIRHHFCPACGCAPFATGNKPDTAETAAINVRCVDGVDLDAVKRKQVDGRSR